MKYTKITPLHDNVVIKQQDESEQQYGSLILPDLGKEKAMVGEIISVGPGRANMLTGEIIPMNLKEGQTVSFPSFGGQKTTIGSEEYLIYKEADIFAVLLSIESI